MKERQSWDEYFLDIARKVAERSKDPSTKVGAVIVGPNNEIISTGYNGFPRYMPDKPELYADREEKYSRIIHCEMNALLLAGKLPRGCTLYTAPFASCDRCVVHMLQAGIFTFVAPKCPEHLLERWGSVLEKTRKYIKECGGILVEV